MRTLTKTIELLKLHVAVIHRDIQNAECRIPAKCMIRVASERKLREIDPKGGDHKVRVDATGIRFKLRGHKYHGPLPKKAAKAMVQWDAEDKARKKAKRDGVEFHSQVKPFTFTLEAVKGAAIKPLTAERQKQINEARRKRILAGKPDKQNYTLHKRVIGIAA
jgi:hypothetical protein